MLTRFSILIAIFASCVGTCAAQAISIYPRYEMVIGPKAIVKPELAKRFVILDAREAKDYDEGHIPAARHVDAKAWAKAFGDGQDAAGWSARIGELGIDENSRVVVYDGAMFKDAGRVWWILRYWGVSDVRLLNGNWLGWKAADFPVDKGPVTANAKSFTARPQPERLATKPQVLKGIEAKNVQIVDARSEDERCGIDKEEKNQRHGTIPGAKPLDWVNLIDKATERFKTPEELRKLFADAGIDLKKPTVTHCQSGGRGAVMAFAMELMGATRVANYYAGWREWGNTEDTPITPPAEKK